jgi:putative ABC transport system permease protein
MIGKLSAKNVLRNKRRTLTTMAIITFGVSMLLLAFGHVEYIKWGLRETVIHGQTGHFQLCSKKYLENKEKRILEYGIDDWQKIAKVLSNISYVNVVTPRITFSGLVSTGDISIGIMVSAVLPLNEIKMGGQMVEHKAYHLFLREPYGILIGPGLAQLLSVNIGDNLTLMTTTAHGSLNAMDFKVIGTVSSGFEEMDNRFAVLSLDSAQRLLASQRVERLLVGLKRTEELPLAVNATQKIIPAGIKLRLWHEVDKYFWQVSAFFNQFIGFFLPVLMLIVWFSTMNTVLTSILERSPELATLRAIGTSNWRLLRLLFSEGMLIGITSVVLGILLELGFSVLCNRFHITLPTPPGYTESYHFIIRNIWKNYVFVSLLTLAIVSLSTLIPARRIFKMNIVKTLRGV